MQLHEAVRRFLIWLRALGRSESTFPTLQCILHLFQTWAKERGVETIEQLTSDLFLAYQEELTFRINRYGRPITLRTQQAHLVALHRWGRYLVEQDLLISDPARRIHLPKPPRPLPRAIPDREEAIRLVTMSARSTEEGSLSAVAGMTLLACRDKAVLELLYSTGLRRGEVANLHLGDLDRVGGYCWVREGKGKKDRVVPIGKMAIAAIEIYLDAVRPSFLKGREEGALFLNHRGRRLSGPAIYRLVKKAVAKARLSPKITPHSLRHAAATHMLQNGAPIRHLQEFLGHASIETTQVYTRITIPELKAVHAKYHPREKENE